MIAVATFGVVVALLPLVRESVSACATEKENTDGECFLWSAELEHHFVEDDHYEYEHDKHKVELNADGRKLVRELPKTDMLQAVGLTTLYEHIERAIE